MLASGLASIVAGMVVAGMAAFGMIMIQVLIVTKGSTVAMSLISLSLPGAGMHAHTHIISITIARDIALRYHRPPTVPVEQLRYSN